MKIPAKLKSVLTKHCPFETASARMIQRVCALFLGQSGNIDRAELFSLCEAAGLDELASFRANFTMNMKKDVTLFDLKKHPDSWSLTTIGKAEAKDVFENGEAPSARPATRGKVKAKPAPKATKKKATKKKAAPKAKAKAKPATKKKATTKAKAKKATTKAKAKPAKAKESAAAKKARLAKKKAAKKNAAPQAAETPAPVAAEASAPTPEAATV